MSNAGGFKSLNRYYDMLAGNTVWSPWEPQGAYDALATVTVSSGGTASIVFSGIPTGYKHLQLRLIARGNNANTYDSFAVFANSDTGSNYTFHYLNGDGSSAAAGAIAPYGAWRGPELTGATATSGMFGVSVVDILDYSNTSKYKTLRVLGGNDRNGTGNISLNSGVWMNTSAISTITINPIFGTAFAQYSSFALFGVK